MRGSKARLLRKLLSPPGRGREVGNAKYQKDGAKRTRTMFQWVEDIATRAKIRKAVSVPYQQKGQLTPFWMASEKRRLYQWAKNACKNQPVSKIAALFRK